MSRPGDAATPHGSSGFVLHWLDEVGETHALAVARIVLGLLLLDAAIRAARELAHGYFGDVFHWPIVPEALVPSATVYGAIVGAEVLLAGLVVVGIQARPALFASAALGTYVLLCDRVQFHHNRWAMACYALLFSLAPCDRHYALAARRSPAPQHLWAQRLAQVQVSIVYLASGGSKFFDADWRDGRVLATRMALYAGNAIAAGVPRGVLDWLSDPSVVGSLAKLAIATELFLAVGLWMWRTRVFALWWGVWFHLTIEATSRVEGFTWLTLAMLGLFATPDVGARRLTYAPERPTSRRIVAVIRRLDWLARFTFEPREPHEPHESGGIIVVGRDGRERSGLYAAAAVARATPLLFPFWLPLAALAYGAILVGFGRVQARARGG